MSKNDSEHQMSHFIDRLGDVFKVQIVLYIVSFIWKVLINLYYKGSNDSARAFAEEMERSGIAEDIRKEPGNLRYQYFQLLNDPETVLLIDSWTDQAAIDAHHASPMMAKLAALREKYDLHMTAERFVSEDLGTDDRFIRK